MELSVGTVVEGKVKQITKFGAFILLPDHSTGMVHISEIAHSFVNDIHDHLTEGQTVNVLVIGNGEIGPLSQKLYDTVTGIQLGRLEDKFGWRVRVD